MIAMNKVVPNEAHNIQLINLTKVLSTSKQLKLQSQPQPDVETLTKHSVGQGQQQKLTIYFIKRRGGVQNSNWPKEANPRESLTDGLNPLPN